MNKCKQGKGAENEEVVEKDTKDAKPDTKAQKECGCDTMSDESFEATDNSSAELAEEVLMWKDKYMRLSAEFDNYRKRTAKEKLELITAGGEEVIKSILVIIDDMERAMAAVESSKDVEAVKEGVELIYQKLLNTMRQRGVAEIEAIGKELDTDLHEAVAKTPAECENKGKIVDVLQKGYKLKDKVVRFAKVVIGE